MSRVDLSKVKHTRRDGRLLATSFNVSVCSECDAAHFDLMDPDGNVFATALIPPDHFLQVAAKFCEFSEFMNADRKQ
jgi:hypothetical protein